MARVEVEDDATLVAHYRNEGVEWPLVRGRLVLEPRSDGVMPLLTFDVELGPGPEPDEAAVLRLKQLIVLALRPGPVVHVRWSRDDIAPAPHGPTHGRREPHHAPSRRKPPVTLRPS